MSFEVIHGDCLEVMRGLPPTSVDACLTDPPYGTTACAWDSVIPFAPMWAELKRIVKPKGAIVLFGSQPFTSALVMSNAAMFKYQWVWDKVKPNGMAYAASQPMRVTEDVCVFAQESLPYNPQTEPRPEVRTYRNYSSSAINGHSLLAMDLDKVTDFYYPRNLLRFSNADQVNRWHPTQKPVDLLRYLVRTYTNTGDTVLDFTCGSGTTGVACEIEGRNSINIDSDGHYCEVARARMLRASGIAADIPRRVKEYPPAPLFDVVEAA